MRIVSQDYFRTLSIQNVAGWRFEDRDRDGAPRVTIVNESLARSVFGTTDVVGRHLTFDKGGPTEAEIVGVTRDVREISRRLAPEPAVYLPRMQQPWLTAETRELVLRMQSGRVPSLAAMQRIVRELDKDVAVGPIAPLGAATAAPIVRMSVYASTVAVAAGISLLLVAFGIYGAVTTIVAERTRQIGICIALGASSMRIARTLGRHGMLPVAVGLAAGVPLALGAGHLVREELFGVETTDPTTFAVVAAMIAAVGITASLIPAARASRVDPARTLRHDSA